MRAWALRANLWLSPAPRLRSDERPVLGVRGVSGTAAQSSGVEHAEVRPMRIEQKIEALNSRTRNLRSMLARGGVPDEAFLAEYVVLIDHLIMDARAASAKHKGHYRAHMLAESGDAECGSSLMCRPRRSS